MKGPKTTFVCRECGTTSIKWLGRCPDCNSWNSFDEIELQPENKSLKNKVFTNLDDISII